MVKIEHWLSKVGKLLTTIWKKFAKTVPRLKDQTKWDANRKNAHIFLAVEKETNRFLRSNILETVRIQFYKYLILLASQMWSGVCDDQSWPWSAQDLVMYLVDLWFDWTFPRICASMFFYFRQSLSHFWLWVCLVSLILDADYTFRQKISS